MTEVRAREESYYQSYLTLKLEIRRGKNAILTDVIEEPVIFAYLKESEISGRQEEGGNANGHVSRTYEFPSPSLRQPVGIINHPSNIIARIHEIFRGDHEVYVAAIKAAIAGGVIDSLRPTSRFVKCFIPATPPGLPARQIVNWLLRKWVTQLSDFLAAKFAKKVGDFPVP